MSMAGREKPVSNALLPLNSSGKDSAPAITAATANDKLISQINNPT